MPTLVRAVASLLFSLQLVSCADSQPLQISQAERDAISAKIYHNECASKPACLTSWNNHENFASMGIGHFIWYPLGVERRYHESFPDFVDYARSRGARLPPWLQYPGRCPWRSKAEFEDARFSPRMIELRDFLEDNVTLQSDFMLLRLENALTSVEKGALYNDRKAVRLQLKRLKQTPQGRYALIDYVNFKGEGLKPSERYNGQGWGLLQVLMLMPLNQDPSSAAQDFAKAADHALTRRVANAKKMGKPEHQWLPGWRKRVYSYPNFSVQ